jgi:serine/threonine-protein phosphatase 2A regulatory subunit B'
VNLVAQHRTQLLPVVLPALEDNSASHWNPAVHGLTMNVRKMFQELDEQLYEDVKRRYESEQQQVRQLYESRDKRWSALQQVALNRAPKGLLEAKLAKYQIKEAPSPV